LKEQQHLVLESKVVVVAVVVVVVTVAAAAVVMVAVCNVQSIKNPKFYKYTVWCLP